MDSKELQRPMTAHKKQISVVSSVERIVENGDAANGRPSLSRSVSITSGRHSGIELFPKPTDSPLDPLNWPKWKRELCYASLLTLTSSIGILKTLLAPVNAILATEFSCSYMAAASLTGVPILLGAFSALGSTMLGRMVGKRAVLIVGAVFMFVGAMWNMHIMDVYAEIMCARAFQGVGWGMIEGVLAEGVQDLFFVHQRGLRLSIFNLVNIFFTWTTPIIGGYISHTQMGWRNQFMVTSVIQSASLLLLIFGTPETTFDRFSESVTSLPLDSLAQGQSTTITTISTTSVSPFKTYLASLRITTPRDTSKSSMRDMLLPTRALAAPSTILTALLTAPLLATTFGIAQSLALLFSPAPTFLMPERIGYLFVLPAAIAVFLSSLFAAGSYVYDRSISNAASEPKSRSITSLALPISGLIIGIGGLLGFSMYTIGKLRPRIVGGVNAAMFIVDSEAMDVGSLWVVSGLFGGLVAGATGVGLVGERDLVSSSLSHSTSASTKAESDDTARLLGTAHKIWQDLFIGIFVVAFPVWIDGSGTGSMLMGLRITTVALSVVALMVGVTAGLVVWVKGDGVRWMDSKVLGRGGDTAMSRRTWKDDESFFEA